MIVIAKLGNWSARSMNTLDLRLNNINEEFKAKLQKVAAARESLTIKL